MDDARWHLGITRKDYAQRGLPYPDKAIARERSLGTGVNASGLVTVKAFLHFYRAHAQCV